ncbi:isochorismatase family protein [Pseudaminobacter soli (ex Li et al. 2025)]|uniref:Isochorismatase n=1 Tax=Pseudaminobacter soli (ex Li et al. 2025) TaxID=1295366 RepID=A0A2P7S353_9HYPH|nr:isochorismatase family cysteine hydrolase [Mesorhizobium soli]PSJ56864.1 isochorismatase [Mesorhizobium soli]
MHSVGIRQEIIDRVVKRRGKLHVFEDLVPSETAVVVIDMQGTFCDAGAPAEVPLSRGIISSINRLNAGVRRLGGRVIWVTHAVRKWHSGNEWSNFIDHFVADEIRIRTLESMVPDAPGQRVTQGLEVDPADIQMIKNRYSALTPGSSQLERVLRSLGIRNLLIVGTKTNVCCESTTRDAMMMDFRPVMISDGTAALSDREHQSALENVIQQFGDVYSVDEVLALIERSKTVA